jgi:hypothetical protein
VVGQDCTKPMRSTLIGVAGFWLPNPAVTTFSVDASLSDRSPRSGSLCALDLYDARMHWTHPPLDWDGFVIVIAGGQIASGARPPTVIRNT